MTTSEATALPCHLEEVKRIVSEMQEIFDQIHSVKNVFRSLLRGVDFHGPMRRSEALEDQMRSLYVTFFGQDAGTPSGPLRRARGYWCQGMVAVMALSEITTRAHTEFDGGPKFRQSRRQELIEQYLTAIKEAGRLWNQRGQGDEDAP